MTYQVLARKWRPQNFGELVGQEKVLAALVHGLNQNRLHHAYLFTGTRGVGKTTVARILAKCLNCEQGLSATPCGACPTCVEIKEGRFVDLIEIDAASRTKVEDTRELLDNVQYAPAKGRFKVYLIDEVHMLSTHSFNALLKTLEEPPEHVKFLLATTDPQKLPVTVLSRCLQFHLKNIEIAEIVKRLKFILAEENISFEEDAVLALSKAAEGSLRDALSLTDQAIGQGEGSVKTETTLHMLGQVHMDLLYQTAQAISTQDHQFLLNLLKAIAAEPVDFSMLLKMIAEFWYEVSLTQTISGYESNLFKTEVLNNLSTTLSPTLIQLFYDMAVNGRKDLPFAPEPRIGFNMTLLRMLAFRPVDLSTPSLSRHPDNAKHSSGSSNNKELDPDALPRKGQDDKQRIPIENWAELIQALPLGGITKEVVKHTALEKVTDNTLFLNIEASHLSFFNDNAKNKLTQALQEYYDKLFTLQINGSATPLSTPAAKAEEAKQAAEMQLQEKLAKDPNIDFIKNNFNGKITEIQLT